MHFSKGLIPIEQLERNLQSIILHLVFHNKKEFTINILFKHHVSRSCRHKWGKRGEELGGCRARTLRGSNNHARGYSKIRKHAFCIWSIIAQIWAQYCSQLSKPVISKYNLSKKKLWLKKSPFPLDQLFGVSNWPSKKPHVFVCPRNLCYLSPDFSPCPRLSRVTQQKCPLSQLHVSLLSL